MLEFDWPWLFFLLPLPLLALFLPEEPSRETALRVPFFGRLRKLEEQRTVGTERRWLTALALWLIWGATLTGASHPQWVGEPIAMPSSGRDLLLAVDISGSMEIEDMQYQGQPINRLQAVKAVVGEFVRERKSDRLGLVLFGTRAYLQAPLTYDRQTVYTLLQEAQIGFAGEKTAIGDAIGLSVKRLRNRPEASRVLILLTDGANNAGELTPQRAAYLAEQNDVTIYTIGFGAERMTTQTIFGQRQVNPSRDLDEETLREVAAQTGGRYFRARSLEELHQVQETLNRLEPIEFEEETYRPTQSLTHWPLAFAFLLSVLMAGDRWLSNRGGTA
ncbi:vWA domain-containing protein [Marinimicrobium agarilyticum]|uniref:vWA domain-containing protein n=1 Tax=Marinimicrobium agarilyticum TaxID=306546 RepID=UPI0004039696|nr:VWA domain-containing protein [Marinimicrobium agarilyticum]